MKRILAMILFVISCLVLVVSIIFAVYGVVDINRVSNELALFSLLIISYTAFVFLLQYLIAYRLKCYTAFRTHHD